MIEASSSSKGFAKGCLNGRDFELSSNDGWERIVGVGCNRGEMLIFKGVEPTNRVNILSPWTDGGNRSIDVGEIGTDEARNKDLDDMW